MGFHDVVGELQMGFNDVVGEFQMGFHDVVGEFQMGFHDVAFMPLQAGLHATFLKKCGSSYYLIIDTCLTTEVGGKQGHTPCKILSLQQSLSLCQSNLVEIIRLSQKWR